jgi:hypothetical protein
MSQAIVARLARILLKIVILRSLLLATKDLGAPCEGLAFHERGANRTSGAHPYQTQKAQPAAAPYFPLYFQNSKLDGGFRHISEIYIRTAISDLGEILRFWGLDKNFGKRRRNGSE